MASGTDEKAKMEGLTSAAAFVEGGIQDACDDACSICLEAFCESDPSTLTGCKHEFHLQCILEWYNIDIIGEKFLYFCCALYYVCLNLFELFLDQLHAC